eukprot:10570825-Ditylum_brightwellii.AAC.1
MKLSLSSAALLVLFGGGSDGWIDEMDMVVAVVSGRKKKKAAKRVHSRVRKLFYRQLHGGDRAKRMKYIARPSLVPIKYSPWQ